MLRALLITTVLLLGEVSWAVPVDRAAWDKMLSKVDSLKRTGRDDLASVLLDSAMVMSRSLGDKAGIGHVMLLQAEMLQKKGESGRALSLLYRALGEVRMAGDSLGLAEVFNSIGTIQHDQKNYEKALEYYRRSGAIYQRLGAEKETGKYWNNLGSLNDDKGDPAEAITFHRRALRVWNSLGDTGWAAVSYMQLGSCYSKLGKTDSARYFLDQSLRDQVGGINEYLQAVTQVMYGTNENRAGQPGKALRFCKDGLAMATRQHAPMLEQRACECLSNAYEALGDKGQALDYFRRSVILRDTLFGEDNVKEMTRIEMDHDFAQKQMADSLIRAKEQVEEKLSHQADVSKEREVRNLALIGVVAVFLLAAGLWSRLRFMRISRARIQRERGRSERLLLNILPATVAQELKDNGKALARDYPRATIMFSDFKDFTWISQAMTAQALVGELDHCFKAFDRIISKRGIEKIKTIGDAYMCVGGLPGLAPSTPADVVRAGLEMQAFITDRKASREAKGLPAFSMRVGIHTGPVVAGVVGLDKFAFDIWGDAVNTANAMERSGEPAKVNISGSTYALVKDEPMFVFIPRGMVEAKGKGHQEMFFVSTKGPVS